MRLWIVNALLRLPWGKSRPAKGHFDCSGLETKWVWDTDAVYTAHWRRRLLVCQWKLMT